MTRRNKISKETRREVWRSMDGRCYYCGGFLEVTHRFEVDHLIPVCYGGTNDFENLIPACQECNRIKGAKDIEEFRFTVLISALELNNRLHHFLSIRACGLSASDADTLLDACETIGRMIESPQVTFFGERAKWAPSTHYSELEPGYMLGARRAAGFYEKLLYVLGLDEPSLGDRDVYAEGCAAPASEG